MEPDLPDFDENGNLPVGVHDSTIESVIRRFGGSKSLKRSKLSKNLNEFYKFVKYYALEIFVDGSFVTAKLSPGDVDILVLFPADFFDQKNIAAVMRFREFVYDYSNLKLHIFGLRKGVDDNVIANYLDLFQTDKYLGVPKGIIRLEIKK